MGVYSLGRHRHEVKSCGSWTVIQLHTLLLIHSVAICSTPSLHQIWEYNYEEAWTHASQRKSLPLQMVD